MGAGYDSARNARLIKSKNRLKNFDTIPIQYQSTIVLSIWHENQALEKWKRNHLFFFKNATTWKCKYHRITGTVKMVHCLKKHKNGNCILEIG